MRHLVQLGNRSVLENRFAAIAALALALLLVTALAACGGSAAPEEGPVAAPAPEAGAAPAQTNTASGGGGGSDAESSGGQSRSNASQLSVSNLAWVPNGEYHWIAMLDVNAVAAGEVPFIVLEENYQPGPGYDSSRKWYGRETETNEYDEIDLNGSLLLEQLGLSPEDLDAVVVVSGFFGNSLVIQGRFDAEEVGRALNDGGEDRQEQTAGEGNLFIGEAGGYKVWRLGGRLSTWSVFLAPDEIFVANYSLDIDTTEELEGSIPLQALASDEKLVGDPANPMARVLERVGTGGLVGAWDGLYCSPSYSKYMAEEGCLATALAFSADGDSSVKARYLLLHDSAERAQAVGTRMQEPAFSEDLTKDELDGEEPRNLSVEVDGEFVVLEMEISGDVGREWTEYIVDLLGGEMP